MTERRKNQSEEWTYFTLLFIYFITVNKYRFCILVIGYINVQIIGIGSKKIDIGRSLVSNRVSFSQWTKKAMHQPDATWIYQVKAAIFPDRDFGLSPLWRGLSDQCLNKGVGELVYVVSESDSVSLRLCFIDLLFEFTAWLTQRKHESIHITQSYKYIFNNNI